MISSGVLRKLMPEKEGGKIVTQCIEQEGPIAFVESTTLGSIFDEDLNRCILIHTDETEEQTRRILEAAARGKSRQSKQAIERQHAIQYMLKPHDVLIPYAEDLSKHIPAEKVEARRAFPMLLTVIRASTLLHQYQRQINADGDLLATESDYAIAYAVMAKPMAEQIGKGVSDVAREYWFYLANAMGDEAFSVQDVMNRNDNPKKRERTYSLVAELTQPNCLTVVEVTESRKKHFRIGNSPDEALLSCIPNPEIFFRELAGQSDGHEKLKQPQAT
jgi:hypothetical protein